MSIDSCNFCGDKVDTDYDDEAYQPDPRMSLKPYPDICVCRHCREHEIAEAEQQAAMDYEPPETGDAWTGGFASNH